MEQKKKKSIFKKWWFWALIVVGLFIILALSTSSTNKSKLTTGTKNDLGITFPATAQEEIDKLKNMASTEITYDQVMGNLSKYKGQVVVWGGRVFTEPEKDDSGVYLQIFSTGSDKNFMVGYAKPDFDVKQDDYLKVYGQIVDKFEGENGFGAKLTVPMLKAGYIEKGDRSVIGKKIKEVTIGDTNSQYNFDFTIEKIYFSDMETIVYCKAKNNSSEKIRFYDYDTKLVQGDKQLEPEYISDKEGRLASEILPGVEAKGIVVFPKLEKTDGQIKLFFDKPSSEDYYKQFKEITFDVNL